MLRDQGVPYSPEVGQSPDNATTYVIDFPVKAPGGSVFKNDLSALDQLEYWKMVKTSFTEHNPSTTISIGDDEWIAVAHWLYENWDIVGGLSFLPRDNHVYQLAPYEEIDEHRYNELQKRFQDIDFSKIMTYEIADETEVKKELACVGGVCEVEVLPDAAKIS
jgi:ribonucleoside-diphosphate reductase alpha chain